MNNWIFYPVNGDVNDKKKTTFKIMLLLTLNFIKENYLMLFHL